MRMNVEKETVGQNKRFVQRIIAGRNGQKRVFLFGNVGKGVFKSACAVAGNFDAAFVLCHIFIGHVVIKTFAEYRYFFCHWDSSFRMALWVVDIKNVLFIRAVFKVPGKRKGIGVEHALQSFTGIFDISFFFYPDFEKTARFFFF